MLKMEYKIITVVMLAINKAIVLYSIFHGSIGSETNCVTTVIVESVEFTCYPQVLS